MKKLSFEWRLAIFWFFLFSVNSLGTCLLAASSGCVWSNLDGQSKLTVALAVFVNWTGCIMAFISKSANRIKHGEILPADADTP